ncbi:MAG: hypothetical protein U1E05_10720 [Patescibacteria group bacterium]|nr:hypothetical protein [Patescibacteria group bacterium]
MSTQTLWSVVLVIVGLLVMLVGAIDPLEGSFVILPGSAVVAAGAFLGKSRYRMLLFWAFVLIATGVGAMVVFTAMGGIGGNSGHSLWWGLFILPYPIGLIIGLVGAILRLIESFKRPAISRQEGP